MGNILRGNPRQSFEKQSDVSLNLAKHLMLNYAKDSNFVFSPVSIQLILGLIAAGSGAQTLKQLLSFLQAKTIDDLNTIYSHLVALVLAKSSNNLCLSFANGVWADESVCLKPLFKHVVHSLYKATSYQVDFQNKPFDAVKFVNSWVKEETSGIIKDILSPESIDRSTRLIFTNALYFNGEWEKEFCNQTQCYKFHLLSGDSVEVPFMRTAYRIKHYIKAFDGFKVLKLPYKQGRNQCLDKRSFSMYIFLPDAKDGLLSLVEKAGSKSGFLERHVPHNEVEVGEFWIPKFKFEYGMELTEALQKLGLNFLFDQDSGLHEMVDDPLPLVVSKIFHKSFIEVDEKGTKASAASGVVAISTCYVRVKRIDFVADHPFLFFIREDTTGTVLFTGHVLNPAHQ